MRSFKCSKAPNQQIKRGCMWLYVAAFTATDKTFQDEPRHLKFSPTFYGSVQ